MCCWGCGIYRDRMECFFRRRKTGDFIGLSSHLYLRNGGELVCRTRDHFGKRWNCQWRFWTRRLSRNQKENEAMEHAHWRLCRTFASRFRDHRLARIPQGNAAQLDWKIHRCISAFPCWRARWGIGSLYYPTRHFVWCDIYDLSARVGLGAKNYHPWTKRSCGRLYSFHCTTFRARPNGWCKNHQRCLYRSLCASPLNPRKSSDLDWGLRLGRIWNRSSDGRALRRSTRLWFRQAFRYSH